MNELKQLPSASCLAILPTRDNQHSGPWPEQVEEEVPVLDSSSSSRGSRDSEGQVGCTYSESSPRQMGSLEEGELGTPGELNTPQPPIFFVDDDVPEGWEPSGIYVRDSDEILGEAEDGDSMKPDLRTSRCFNCGSPEHIVSACPSPADHKLISLSRQIYNFIRASRGIPDFQRIHVVEEWRQQRLEWLEIFEPGEIRGALLQDALGEHDGDWLGNIAVWGYPKGWVSVRDPRERIRQLIWQENSDGSGGDDLEEDDQPFLIFGEDDQVDMVYLTGGSPPSDGDSSDAPTTPLTAEPLDPNDHHATRWAHYPPSHFASHLLPIYNGLSLPPISHRGSSTYTSDRNDLWQRIVSGIQAPHPSIGTTPPWRLPSVPDSASRDFHPAPPLTDPPPLPPPPPNTDPPPRPPLPPSPLYAATTPSKDVHQSIALDACDDTDEQDMDMSDSD